MQLTLTEWTAADMRLPADVAVAVAASPGGISVTRLGGDLYRLIPSQYVGSIHLPGVEIVIRPKVEIRRLFYLLGFSGTEFEREHVGLDSDANLTEAFVRAFLVEVRRALRTGPLMGYRHVDEAGATFRGRLRVVDQARRRYGLLLPVELSYDDYTIDIDENRVLRAAFRRIERMRLMDDRLRGQAAAGASALEGVADVQFPSSWELPNTTRLTRRYEASIRMARVILAGTTAELAHGNSRVPAFLVDMNRVFEDFVFRSLSRVLDRPPYQWRSQVTRHLDEGRRVRIRPDLSLWRSGRCVFVADAKYKRTAIGEQADLYQLLAYCRSMDVGAGMLIYPSADRAPIAHTVRNDGTRLIVRALVLDESEAEINRRVGDLAEEIRGLTTGPFAGRADDSVPTVSADAID